jgi:hypothetical protein
LFMRVAALHFALLDGAIIPAHICWIALHFHSVAEGLYSVLRVEFDLAKRKEAGLPPRTSTPSAVEQSNAVLRSKVGGLQ